MGCIACCDNTAMVYASACKVTPNRLSQTPSLYTLPTSLHPHLHTSLPYTSKSTTTHHHHVDSFMCFFHIPPPLISTTTTHFHHHHSFPPPPPIFSTVYPCSLPHTWLRFISSTRRRAFSMSVSAWAMFSSACSSSILRCSSSIRERSMAA